MMMKCKCGCDRSYSQDHLEKYGYTKFNATICKLPQIMCQKCLKLQNFLYLVIVDIDNHIKQLCGKCYINQVKYIPETKHTIEKYTEQIDIKDYIENSISEKMSMCYNLFNDKKIRKELLEDVADLRWLLLDVNDKIREYKIKIEKDKKQIIHRFAKSEVKDCWSIATLNLCEINDIYSFDKYIITIILVLNKKIPKEIIHKILMYLMNDEKSIILSDRLRYLY